LLDDAFLEELFEAFAEAFVVGGAAVVQGGEALRDEAGGFVEEDAGFSLRVSPMRRS
jgi:hypothetical protein